MQNLFFISDIASLFEYRYICTKIFIETLIGMINKERLLRLLHIIMQSINEYRKIEAFFSFFLRMFVWTTTTKNVYVSYLQATEYRSCLLWAYAWIAQLFSSVSYLQMFFCDRFWKNTYNNNGLPLTR